ncbi:hypothetical protein FHX81_0395 [Saccharothrix saharensis]|uniref:Uncharacterized protein n=1 Tax=Saccharothrix saharensis TaxID=571190 RepID=A0A543J5L8_9PSEU|nr:hypothetical protein [Saccharothrix saharensis]TQM78145.1 hypothetical protein FHX81_0395 [Saccharothrix saharensis]
MGDRIVPSLTFGSGPEPAAGAPPPYPTAARHDRDVPGNRCHPDGAPLPHVEGSTPRRRELDLRRTEAPGPGVLARPRTPPVRRYAVRAFDGKGRIADRPLFGLLGWDRGTPVSIHAHDSGVLVMRRDPDGGSALTERVMVAVPAPLLRWCGFGSREHVLLVAVPSLSALVVHGLEVVDRLLPDAERMVSEASPVREQLGDLPTGSAGAGARREPEVAGD